ncbi:uncharacterized protein LOC105186486 isoform X2 [Harpegnathos saltator]|uniref:uncharacterized protein LOC105186486 isoform X2 n=1 Tax=Harpegnathos saltator TaxID=610380 RepID=UPI00058F51C6|nr:uncharacterized protein LOC105186486 isoform X2 [Harpegnathos saltator]
MKRAEARNHHGGCRTMDAGSDTSYISRYLLYKGCCDYTTEAAPQDASLAETDPGMQVWRMRVCRTRMQHRRIRFGPSRIRLEDLSSRMWPPLSSGCTRGGSSITRDRRLPSTVAYLDRCGTPGRRIGLG